MMGDARKQAAFDVHNSVKNNHYFCNFLTSGLISNNVASDFNPKALYLV